MGNQNANNGTAGIVFIVLISAMCCFFGVSSLSSLLGILSVPGGKTYGDMSTVWRKQGSYSVKPGPWESDSYGTMDGHTPIGGECPSGSYITDVIAFHGQDEHTNAIQGFCWDPKKKDATRIFSPPTCGKRDHPDAKAALQKLLTPVMVWLTVAATALTVVTGGLATPLLAATIALTVATTVSSITSEAIIAQKMKNEVLAPGYGRKLWDYKYKNDPAGYYRWAVRSKDGVIQGLNMYGLGGEELTWAGGNARRIFGPKGPRSGEPTGTITKAQCPKGKIVTGIRASCGDRVDGIQFICNTPPITK
jgi:hypothetical protein